MRASKVPSITFFKPFFRLCTARSINPFEEQPYSDMSDKQVIENTLKGKNRKILSKPDVCPLEVYKVMLECWAHNSEQRATFEELFQLLTSIYHNV